MSKTCNHRLLVIFIITALLSFLLAAGLLHGTPTVSLGEETVKYEFEDAEIKDDDNVTLLNTDDFTIDDSAASNRKKLTEVKGKYIKIENVVEGNYIHIAYASQFTNSMLLFIRYPEETEPHEAGRINFSTTNSWLMNSYYVATSSKTYIPKGSDIIICPREKINLDYLWLTNEGDATPEDAIKNILTADKISSDAKYDAMAPYSVSFSLSEGKSVDFFAPTTERTFNAISVSYSSRENASIKLSCGGRTLLNLNLPATEYYAYGIKGSKSEAFSTSEKITVSCIEGRLDIGFIKFGFADDPEKVSVKGLPSEGERLTVSLNGVWAFDITKTGNPLTPPANVPNELSFGNAIPVPGLWHSAAFDFGDYKTVSAWYKKTVVFDNKPEGQAILYIGSAQYGRHIYVNGSLAGVYEYNYSHSYTDITDYLVAGENEIVIMLGNWYKQANDPSCTAHVLYDGESTGDEPGITDNVSLILNAAPEVEKIQVNPDIDAGKVQTRITLKNRSATNIVSDVTVKIYELGIFTDGIPDRTEIKVGEYVAKNVEVNAEDVYTFTVDGISIGDWNKNKCWSPKNPFLYRIEVTTSGDTYSTRFGMRTFSFDPETKYAKLNGEICYLFGTNVAIERYHDDPLCGTTPWEEQWIRKLYKEFRDVNWVCFRTHLGHDSSIWFDIADETGFMIFTEYPNWGDLDGCTVETIMPEIYAWMDARLNHPSVIVFDALNEGLNAEYTDEVIRRGREYDLQKRPWDNGWRAPVSDTDPVECHPYIINVHGISGLNEMTVSTPIVTTAYIGWTSDDYPDNPYLINEHGEYWINRDGLAMSGTEGTWNFAYPNATNEERLSLYAELMSAQIGAFRSKRAYVGILFFCGLASSFPSAKGVTSDILSHDVSTAESLQIRPYTKELLKDAFADLGITITRYQTEVMRGKRISVPITLINDTGEDVNDLPVTLKITSGNTVVYADRTTISVKAFSGNEDGLAKHVFMLNVPDFADYCQDGQELILTAYYELDGKIVSSVRKWEVRGGDTSDTQPEKYDWLTPDGGDATPANSANGWLIAAVIGGAAILCAGATLAVIIVKKRKSVIK